MYLRRSMSFMGFSFARSNIASFAGG